MRGYTHGIHFPPLPTPPSPLYTFKDRLTITPIPPYTLSPPRLNPKSPHPPTRSFIRRRVADPRDAEDILQDVFHALVEANRLLMPIDHVTGWLYRVARNRIIDLFRARRPNRSSSRTCCRRRMRAGGEFARTVLFDALEEAIARAAGGAARRLHRPRTGRTQLQGDVRGDGRERQHPVVAEAYAVLRLRERLQHLRRHDEGHEDLHMNIKRFMEVAIHHPAADRGRAVIAAIVVVRLRRDRDAALELAAAAALRLARDHAAAGIRAAGAVPDAVWRVRRRRRWRPSSQTDDPGGARAIARPAVQHDSFGSGRRGDRQLELDTEEPGIGVGGGVDSCGVSAASGVKA